MIGSIAVMLGFAQLIVLTIGVFKLLHRQPLSPRARYRREICALHRSTYLRTRPRPARQPGADGLAAQSVAGAWLS